MANLNIKIDGLTDENVDDFYQQIKESLSLEVEKILNDWRQQEKSAIRLQDKIRVAKLNAR